MKKYLALFLVLLLSILPACYSLPKVQTRPQDVGAWSQLCFHNISGAAYYLGKCTMRPLKWDKFPLVVAYDLKEHPATIKALYKAEERIEKAVARDLIELHHVTEYEIEGEDRLRPEFDVLIVYDMSKEDREGLLGYARHTWKDGRLSAMIGLLDKLKPVGMVNVLMHELGHVFGLRHDDLRSSLMYKALNSNSTNYKSFTKKDINILRKM